MHHGLDRLVPEPAPSGSPLAATPVETSLAALGDLDTLLLLAGVTVLAVATKFAGAYLGAIRMAAVTRRSSASGWCRAARSGSSSPGSATRPRGAARGRAHAEPA